jgi:NTP pyrophosphatase (non-canonical NTP hydrolase)
MSQPPDRPFDSPAKPLPQDSTTTLGELRSLVRNFVQQRDWRQFHAPKNLSMALAIEAAELMEHFQWVETEASRAIAEDPEKLAQVAEELADVIAYGLALANELEIDLAATIYDKMEKNCRKYPVDEYHGRYEKGDA